MYPWLFYILRCFVLYTELSTCVIYTCIYTVIAFTSIQAVLGGVLRGCGKQLLVAVSNIGSFYLLGLPVSLTLVYAADMGALGFWVGCAVGSVAQVKKCVKRSYTETVVILTVVDTGVYFDATHRLQAGIPQGMIFNL